MNKQDWTYKKLGEVCESELGKTLNSTKDTGKLYPYLCAVNVLWDRIDTSSLKETRFEETELERYSVKKGDLLICEGGDIGRAAIWNKEQPIQYQNALHRVRFNDEVLPRFCLMYLRCLKEKGILDGRYGKGVTIKHLVKSSLLSIPIPVPPIAEQERIVAELDLLQGIIKKKKEQLKAYDQLAQSIFYTMFGDPIDNPKGWEVKKFGEVASLITDGDWIESKDQSDNGIRLIQTGNIGSGFFIAKDDKPHFISETTFYSLGCTEVFVGDCLISRLPSPVGRACLIPKTDYRMITAVDCSIVRFKDIILPQFFINYSLSSGYQAEIDRKTTGTTRKRISRKNLERIPVPVPPLSLQQEFAEKMEAIERQKALVQQSIDETQTMFDFTMDKYFG